MAIGADVRPVNSDGRIVSSQRVGIFGGTFDPPHLGHVSAARDVADYLDLDEVIWIPARRSPLKDAEAVDPSIRLEMVECAAAADPRFRVDARELGRPGPSFTIDTLRDLRDETLADAELFLIIGVDQFADFDRWKDPEQIRSLATLAVMDREGRSATGGEGWSSVPVRRVDVSSSDIRRRVAKGEEVDGLVPEGVRDVIRREGLYLDAKGEGVA